MGVLLFIVFGAVVGLVAREVLAGKQERDLLTTDIISIVGSFAGALVSNLVTGHDAAHFHAAGVVGSVIGAALALLGAGELLRRRALVQSRAPGSEQVVGTCSAGRSPG
jgi:uncharacterized membrane protein YeaQ/YmgE (transglycosylase-associated protein family)